MLRSLAITVVMSGVLCGCASDAEMAQRRLEMQREMVGVRQRRAQWGAVLASPQVAAAVGEVIGCAIAGGCRPVTAAPAPRPTLECKARPGVQSNGSAIYRCE